MIPSVRLVVAAPSDLATLTGFIRQLREDDPEEGAFDEARSVPAMRRLISEPALGRVWLIEFSGETAGYVALTFCFSIELGGVMGFVDELFVKREFRGRGIGTQTLGAVIAEATGVDVAVLALEVTRSNDVAKRVYSKVGFVDREHHLMTMKLK